MTATAVSIKEDKQSLAFGLVESASVNSIADFVPSTSNEIELNPADEMQNFVTNFICHLIFYVFFCVLLIIF